ncbi:protein SYS1 homolog [Daphnia pulicaria]|uniref:protein SYS1 homolog n=1 Tax=Daphnia pulicaria TaxID=35523 RepID=UPI001EEB6B3B|nr:protein SYS1 homolog [Daphnia pulicaria]XP_046650438.1 protein SYS1 homolog [Daphnia pulicaria]
MSGSFRIAVWDPPLILSQIIAVQCIMYVSLGLWIIVLLNFLAGHPVSIDYIFKYQEVNVKDVSGRLVVACFLLNSLISATSLWAIVQRTKLCLDFSATAFFLHLVASLIYNSGWPYSASWWVLQFSCVTITCVLAEFLCMRSEMKSIPLGMSARVDL